MYDSILVATDASRDSVAAVDHAVMLARATNAALHIISIVETRTAYDNAIVDPDEVRENLRADARAAVETAVGIAEDAEVEYHTAIEEGPPPECLLDHINAIDADIVVLGATGQSAFKRLVVGSTAERLLADAPIPVIVVGQGADTGDDIDSLDSHHVA